MILSKSAIQKKASSKIVTHYVKEWGGDVNIKVLKLSERIDIEEEFLSTLPGEEGDKKIQAKDMQKLYATICIAAIVDKSGKQLFDNVDELYNLAGPIPQIVSDIFAVAAGVNEPKKKEPKKSETDS